MREAGDGSEHVARGSSVGLLAAVAPRQPVDARRDEKGKRCGQKSAEAVVERG